MRSKLFLYLGGLLLVLGVVSCEDEADIPAYVVVTEPNFVIPPEFGTSHQVLTENYIRQNGNFIGATSFGGELPIIPSEDDLDEIVTFGGVRQNGIGTLPSIYFPFSSDTFRVDLEPNETYTFTPTYRYIDNVQFNIVEDFESSNTFTLDLDGLPSTSLARVDGIGFDGSGGGLMRVTDEDRVLIVGSDIGTTGLSTNTGDMYIELTYRNDVSMAVGLFSVDPSTGRSEQIPALTLFPSEEFSKIYLELSRQIRTAPFERIHIVFSILHDGREGPVEAVIDDVKFLTLR